MLGLHGVGDAIGVNCETLQLAPTLRHEFDLVRCLKDAGKGTDIVSMTDWYKCQLLISMRQSRAQLQ